MALVASASACAGAGLTTTTHTMSKHKKTSLGLTLSLATIAGGAIAMAATTAPGDGDDVIKPSFSEPVRLMAGGKAIATEAPGYASPAWHDTNGDGRPDLVVGQFSGGKMNTYAQKEDGSFEKGTWIEAGGKVAEVPGVW